MARNTNFEKILGNKVSARRQWLFSTVCEGSFRTDLIAEKISDRWPNEWTAMGEASEAESVRIRSIFIQYYD